MTMSQINPITGSILQAPAAQRQQETQKVGQTRRVHDRARNSAASDEEEAEKSVASPDELQPSGDEQKGHPQRKRTYSRHQSPKSEPNAEGDGLDLEA